MTIDLRPPQPADEAALRILFTEAFGDESFTELFFRHGFSPNRCLAAFGGELLAALHWFDCTLEGQKAAYLYGIAAFEAHRGLGIGSKLIDGALSHLKQLGYGPVFLVPAEPALFGYYERFGFRQVSSISQRTVTAAAPIPVRRLNAAEYAELRRAHLPAHSLIQEGPALALLGGYAKLYATDRAVAAVSGDMVWELLGDLSDAPGLIAALGLPQATIRTPGAGRPFAMGVNADAPVYLGLALD